jgi:hypothetical protein
VPLTREQIEQAVRIHVEAESISDMVALRETLRPDVDYRLMTPRYDSDPTPHGRFTGADTYIDMWQSLHEVFETYAIRLERLTADVDNQCAWLTIRADAVPYAEWRGLPAGKPITWWAAAICSFDEDGAMTAEEVFGSMPPTLAGYDRMKEHLREEAGS